MEAFPDLRTECAQLLPSLFALLHTLLAPPLCPVGTALLLRAATGPASSCPHRLWPAPAQTTKASMHILNFGFKTLSVKGDLFGRPLAQMNESIYITLRIPQAWRSHGSCHVFSKVTELFALRSSQLRTLLLDFKERKSIGSFI